VDCLIGGFASCFVGSFVDGLAGNLTNTFVGRSNNRFAISDSYEGNFAGSFMSILSTGLLALLWGVSKVVWQFLQYTSTMQTNLKSLYCYKVRKEREKKVQGQNFIKLLRV
jgi:hypothetical protein